ncbi:MAG: hypothetical protein Q8M03_12415 [Legionella sp.]|nr:hypothetical protein [Legionella sp.]
MRGGGKQPVAGVQYPVSLVIGGFGVVVISPKDQVGFIRALKRVAPQLRLEGGLEGLVVG